MKHVVLLGDSVFDNAAYVGGGPHVARQLRGELPEGWHATLTAVDGAVMADIPRQLEHMPQDATHLVLSVGGNDALLESDVLDAPAGSVAEAVAKLAHVRVRFWRSYRSVLDTVHGRGLRTAVCTIYEPPFSNPPRRELGATALTLLNDCITREAFARGMSLNDLRLVFDREEDFANTIEPSARGGAKLARAISRFVTEDCSTCSRVIAS